MDQMKSNRDFLKCNFQKVQEIQTDQQLGKPNPPLQKPVPPGAELITLPKVNPEVIKQSDVYSCLKKRRSIRKYGKDALTRDELSFLLWATQGVQRVFGDNYATFRPVPSGGARHPFETYLIVSNVADLENGVYRYLPLSHQLYYLFSNGNFRLQLAEIMLDQPFILESPLIFVWSCVPYRTEWRYHIAAHKNILIDAGHLCQNLYLGCTAIGCGACAIGAYDQEKLDAFLGLDGTEEFAVYLAPVGKVK